MIHRGFVIPDRIFFILGGSVVVLTWIMAILMYPATRDITVATEVTMTYIFVVKGISFPVYFLFPLFELILFLSFVSFYHTPEQAALRPGMKIAHVREPHRTRLMRMYRHFIVMLLVLLELIVMFMFIANFSTISGVPTAVNGSALLLLLAALVFVVLVYWSWMNRTASSHKRTA